MLNGPKKTYPHKQDNRPISEIHDEATILLINEPRKTPELPPEIDTLLQALAAHTETIITPLSHDNEKAALLQAYYTTVITKIKEEKPGFLSTRNENLLNTIFAYFAAIKGSIGAAALIELLSKYIASACNLNMENPEIWGPMLAAEILIGILALSLNLPFYFKNVRDGLLAFNLATPATLEEVQLREKIEKMSWARYFSSFLLAFGAGLGQGGMATLGTFFLSFLQNFTSKYVPNQATQWLLGIFVFASNFVIYFPKSDKALDIFQALTNHDIPWHKRLLQTLEYTCSVLAVVPNILGAGAIFSQQMQSLDPLYQKLIISFSGLIMSIGPIGLNADELEKLLQAKEGFCQQLKKNYGGYLAAAVSASFSCIFTYQLVTQVFGGVRKNDNSPITNSNIGVEVAAISLTLFNTLFLILTKGRPFADHYRNTNNYKDFLAKIFGGCYPTTAEERWTALIKALESLKTNGGKQEKADFVNAFQVFIRLIPNVHYHKDPQIRNKIRVAALGFADTLLSLDYENSLDSESGSSFNSKHTDDSSEVDLSSDEDNSKTPRPTSDDLTDIISTNNLAEASATLFYPQDSHRPPEKKATCFVM